MLVSVHLMLMAVGCDSDQDQGVKLRLGYFPNVTHAQPIIGLARGTFVETLGPKVTLETTLFNAGPAAIEGLFAGRLDAVYVGPNPAINGYVRSEGKALRIVAGAASGGAALIVREDGNVTRVADFARKRVASPQLGNTQDVALRTYLMANGLAPRENGGNVTVAPVANPEILSLFKRGDIEGAWVPEPWASRLINEAGGRVLVDERELWPNGEFVTTVLAVRKEFLDRHPEVVKSLVKAHMETTQWINEHSDESKRLTNEGVRKASGAALPQEIMDAAWSNLKFTSEPLVTSLDKVARHAFRLGFLGKKEPDLSEIYSLETLGQVRQGQSQPALSK